MSQSIPFTHRVDIPKSWFDFLEGADIFARGYSGFWCYGVEHIDAYGKKGWICYEHGDSKRPTDEEIDTVVYAFVGYGQPLPERWFFLDQTMAIRAYIEGVKRWGDAWYEDADASRYDVALQLAALGEVRYG